MLRWALVAGALLVVFLYYRPLRTYLDTRHTLAARAAEVRTLQAQRAAFERRLKASLGEPALVQEARRLALVKPGERLFIVKGIAAWKRKHRATLPGDG